MLKANSSNKVVHFISSIVKYSSLCFLVACAPFSAMPPPEHFSMDQRQELGVSGGGGMLFSGDGIEGPGATPFGQAWWYYRLNKKHTLGVKAQFVPESNNGGVFYRYAIQNNEKQYLGIEADVGALYLKTAVPMAWRNKNGQLYTSPALMLHATPAVMLPVGYNAWIGDNININIEAGVGVWMMIGGIDIGYDGDTTKFGLGGSGYASFGLGARW